MADLDSDERYQRFLFLGYEYNLAEMLKNKGAVTKKDAIKLLRKYILMNIRDFNINPDRGKFNKINKALPSILWYFKK